MVIEGTMPQLCHVSKLLSTKSRDEANFEFSRRVPFVVVATERLGTSGLEKVASTEIDRQMITTSTKINKREIITN